MTNRDCYLLMKNEYDVLCGIQNSLLKGCMCIIGALTGQSYPCKNNNSEIGVCCECIGEWLNKKGN